jgi:hypothetical protein
MQYGSMQIQTPNPIMAHALRSRPLKAALTISQPILGNWACQGLYSKLGVRELVDHRIIYFALPVTGSHPRVASKPRVPQP